MAIDMHGDRRRAQAALDANLSLLRDRGIDDPIVLDVDPIADADTHVQHLHAVARLRLEMRALPTGGAEIQGVHCLPHIDEIAPDARALARQRAATPQNVARSFRIVHAPGDIVGARTPILRREVAR